LGDRSYVFRYFLANEFASFGGGVKIWQAMLLVGQEIALTFDFCSTATPPLAKRGHPLWIPPLTKNLPVTKKIIHTTFFA
jgi:hypothetical protein